MTTRTLSPEILDKTHAYWRAVNYLLKDPLRLSHVIEHKLLIDKHGQDLPEVRNWMWSNAR